MKKYSKLMAVLLVVAMLLPGIAQAAPVAQDQAKVMRVAGDSRVGTSIKVSEVAMDSATDAVLVGYSGEADALTGAIVAKAKNAPLFYVRDNEVEAVKARLDDLGVANVHVLGGTTVFTEKLMKEFDAYNPVRIDGDNRYETAINAAKVAVGDKADTVFLAKGNETLADALSIGAISAKENTPLLLTHGTNLTEVTKQALKDMEVKNIEIIGGKSAVSEEIKEELEGLGYTVNRTAGDNRQATSVEIAKKFNPDAKEIVIANGFDYADAVTAGYFAAGRDAVVLLTNQNLVHPTVKEFLEDNKLDTTVLGGTLAIAEVAFDKVVEYLDGVVVEMPEEEEELKVESVSAITAKEMKVTFNKAVAETDKAVFELKKGSVKVNTSEITWNEDKTEVVIELTGKITAGEYTVNVTGLTEEALTATVTAEDEKVVSITLLDDKAPITNDTDTKKTVTMGYKVENQYGEDVTATTVIDSATAAGTSVRLDGTVSAKASKGTVTINVKDEVKVDDSIVLTLIHTKTGVSVSETIKVAAKSALADIAITDIYNKDAKTLTETTDLTKDTFYLIVEGKDQYGNVLKQGDLGGLISNNTNPLIVKLNEGQNPTVETITVDKKEVTAIKLVGPVTAGETTVMLISPNTGKNATQKITVAEAQRTDKVVMEVPELVVANEDLFVPITVTDKEGNVVTDINVIKNGTRGIKVSGLVNNIEKKDDKIGIMVKADDLGTVGYKSLVAISSTSKSTVENFEVKAAAKATIVTGLSKDESTTLLVDGTATLNTSTLQVEDQYGRIMTKASLDAWVNVDGNSIEVKKVVGTEDKVTITDNESIQEIAHKATITGKAKGTQKISVTLKVGADEISTSTKEITFKVTDGTEYVSYEVEEVGTMFDVSGAFETPADDAAIAAAGDRYDKEINVYGVLSDGSKVELKEAGDYTVVAGAGLNATDTKTLEVDSAKVAYADDKVKEAKADLTVTINATGKQYKQEVTISKVAPKIADFKVVAVDVTGANKADYDKAKVKSEVETDLNTGEVANLVDFLAVDNYGVYHNMADATNLIVSNLKLVATPKVANTITFTNQNKDDLTFNGLELGESFTVKASADGVEKIFNVIGKYDGEALLAAAIEAKVAGINAVELETEGKTAESITEAEDKLVELKEAAVEEVEALETVEEVEAYEFDATEAEELLLDVPELISVEKGEVTEEEYTFTVKGKGNDLGKLHVLLHDGDLEANIENFHNGAGKIEYLVLNASDDELGVYGDEESKGVVTGFGVTASYVAETQTWTLTVDGSMLQEKLGESINLENVGLLFNLSNEANRDERSKVLASDFSKEVVEP